jgi:hypothetical protein
MDRRKMLAMLGLGPTLITGSSSYARPVPEAVWAKSPAAGDGLITVMNPGIPNKLATRHPLAPPLDNLNDKTIYMINLSWEGPDAGNYFYGAMGDWLAQRYPGIKTVVKVTADGMFGLDPAILKEMTANEADGAIVGVAG